MISLGVHRWNGARTHMMVLRLTFDAMVDARGGDQSGLASSTTVLPRVQCSRSSTHQVTSTKVAVTF